MSQLLVPPQAGSRYPKTQMPKPRPRWSSLVLNAPAWTQMPQDPDILAWIRMPNPRHRHPSLDTDVPGLRCLSPRALTETGSQQRAAGPACAALSCPSSDSSAGSSPPTQSLTQESTKIGDWGQGMHPEGKGSSQCTVAGGSAWGTPGCLSREPCLDTPSKTNKLIKSKSLIR